MQNDFTYVTFSRLRVDAQVSRSTMTELVRPTEWASGITRATRPDVALAVFADCGASLWSVGQVGKALPARARSPGRSLVIAER
jgi:hypothetical protein